MYLTRRDGIYYLRKRVPVDLVAVYGKREILRSLSVKERGAAARLALRAVVALDDEFAQKRGLTQPSVERTQAPRPSPSMPARPPVQSPTLDELIPIWRRENGPTDKTADAVARAVADVGNPAVTRVTRATVAGMRDIWLEKGNSAATVSKKVGFIRLLLTVARNRGLIATNPAEGMELRPHTRGIELRQPFSPEQVQSIFAATAKYRDTEPVKYWIPRLGHLTGARLNELCQLRTSDIIVHEGICGLLLTDQGEYLPGVSMTLKNAASRRFVPLHPTLARFAEWATALQSARSSG
jgi:hypothetical protein